MCFVNLERRDGILYRTASDNNVSFCDYIIVWPYHVEEKEME